MLITLRYETAVLIPVKEGESANIALLSILLTVAGAVILIILASIILKFVKIDLFSGLEFWLPFALMVGALTALITIFQCWMNRRMQYTEMAFVRVLQNLSIAALSIFFGLFLNLESGLILSQIIGLVITCTISWLIIRKISKLWKFEKLVEVAKKHKQAPKYLLASDLIDEITLHMPIILIALWFTENMAGQFGMAWKLLLLPISLIGISVSQVFQQKFSKLLDSREKSRSLIRKTWLSMFALGVMPSILFYTWGDVLIIYFLGSQWTISAEIATAMTPMILAFFIFSPTSGVYVLLNMQKTMLKMNVITAIYRPLCIYIGFLYQDLMLGLYLWIVFELLFIVFVQRLILLEIDNQHNMRVRKCAE
jgi:O-antigen/teichoic acid export membrane protein